MSPKAERVGGVSQHRTSVLLIDDQPMIGEAVRRMLEGESDIDFCYCSDPALAVETANQIQPTVILQDLVMPDIDGMLLVKFFRANPQTSDTPLIVLSTKEEPATKAEAFALGANDYVVKLPDRLELLARIRYHSRGYISLLERNEAYSLMNAELREAEEYVRNLLPPPLKEGTVTTDWRFIPSSSLGGDAFGYHTTPEGKFALYLLDVCGHGVGAALLSISVMNVLRSAALPKVDFQRPGEVLAGLNDAFPMERQGDKFFSVWYGVYDPQTRELAYASGGHPPAVLFTGDSSEPVELKAAGMCIGYMPGVRYEEKTLKIARAARLYLFSDGIFELFDIAGKQWPYPDFLATLCSGEGLEPVVQAARTYQSRDDFEDDYSLVELCFN